MDNRRKHPRYKFELPVEFSADDDFKGTGLVHNLSQEGCLIESDIAVCPGIYLKLILHLSDEIPSLEVESAAVRWVKGRVFGVELLYMGPKEFERLSEFLTSQDAPEV